MKKKNIYYIVWGLCLLSIIIGGCAIYEIIHEDAPVSPTEYVDIYGIQFIKIVPSVAILLICFAFVLHGFNPIKLVWEIKYGDSEWEDFAIGFVNETEVKQMIEMVIK